MKRILAIWVLLPTVACFTAADDAEDLRTVDPDGTIHHLRRALEP